MSPSDRARQSDLLERAAKQERLANEADQKGDTNRAAMIRKMAENNLLEACKLEEN